MVASLERRNVHIAVSSERRNVHNGRCHVGKIQSRPGWGHKPCTYIRPTAIYTHINSKTTQEPRSLHSDLEYFQVQQPSNGLWLGLELGLGLGSG